MLDCQPSGRGRPRHDSVAQPVGINPLTRKLFCCRLGCPLRTTLGGFIPARIHPPASTWAVNSSSPVWQAPVASGTEISRKLHLANTSSRRPLGLVCLLMRQHVPKDRVLPIRDSVAKSHAACSVSPRQNKQTVSASLVCSSQICLLIFLAAFIRSYPQWATFWPLWVPTDFSCPL